MKSSPRCARRRRRPLSSDAHLAASLAGIRVPLGQSPKFPPHGDRSPPAPAALAVGFQSPSSRLSQPCASRHLLREPRRTTTTTTPFRSLPRHDDAARAGSQTRSASDHQLAVPAAPPPAGSHAQFVCTRLDGLVVYTRSSLRRQARPRRSKVFPSTNHRGARQKMWTSWRCGG